MSATEHDTDRLNRAGARSAVTEARRDRYARNVERGLCTRGASHGAAEPGHTMCIGCLVDQRHDQNARNARIRPRKRVLTCLRCGQPGRNSRSCPCPVPAGFDPQRARTERTVKYRATLRAQGLCPNNPKHERPGPGFSQCAACRARGKAKP